MLCLGRTPDSVDISYVRHRVRLVFSMQDLLQRRRQEASTVGLFVRPTVFDVEPSSSRDMVLASPGSSAGPSTPSPAQTYSAAKSLFLTTARPKQGVLSITQARFLNASRQP